MGLQQLNGLSSQLVAPGPMKCQVKDPGNSIFNCDIMPRGLLAKSGSWSCLSLGVLRLSLLRFTGGMKAHRVKASGDCRVGPCGMANISSLDSLFPFFVGGSPPHPRPVAIH